MKPGDLVRIEWSRSKHVEPIRMLGTVVEYEPDVLGGSSCHSWFDGRTWQFESVVHPRRGQVLIVCYDDGSMSWWDENNVRKLEDSDGT